MFQKNLRRLAGILFIPIAIGTWQAFYTLVSAIGVNSGVLHLIERGILCYLIFHVFVVRPVYLYVLGHEFVHVLATWVSGGRVVTFSVSPAGGNVVTSKTNFFIELSPYFVPIYTILTGIIFWTFKVAGSGGAVAQTAFLFIVGFTIAFHFVMTSEALRAGQSDIARSGRLFSLIIIFVGNLIIVGAVFCALFTDLSFVSFMKNAGGTSIELYKNVYTRIIQLAGRYIT